MPDARTGAEHVARAAEHVSRAAEHVSRAAEHAYRPAEHVYRAIPIAECWGDSGWRAGVLLSADDPRGDRPAKSLSARLFDSREAALQFAESEYGALGR